MAAENPKEGLLPKYRVEKIKDPEGKHDECRYFVLDPQHDKRARSALVHYATLARLDGYEALYLDIMGWLMGIEQEEQLGDLRSRIHTIDELLEEKPLGEAQLEELMKRKGPSE